MKKHNRKLGLSGVSLTQVKNRLDLKALTAVREEIEKVLESSGYLDRAPFSWVTIAIRYGLIDAAEPTYQPINAQYQDLPLSIEVDAHKMPGADLDQLIALFRKAVLRCLIHAGRKYQRPTEVLEQLFTEERPLTYQ